MGKHKPKEQCPYNEGCACTQKNCGVCGWYPKDEKKEETKEEKE